MAGVAEPLAGAVTQVIHALFRVWPYLLGGTVVASSLRVLVPADRVAALLARNQGTSVLVATGVAVGTPLCSCGTMAVVLAMMAGRMSWAPIVAFMVASPLTSPQELFYSAGLFGWPFALTFFGSSITLGLAGGRVAHLLETRGLLVNQARFNIAEATSGGVVSRGATRDGWLALRFKWHTVFGDLFRTAGRLLLYFLGFAFVGYFLNGLIPKAWMPSLFGGGRVLGVPLAATVGVPLYFSTAASLPLVRTMVEAGASPGAAMAFLITGAGTSIGAITGALTIARWRVVTLVVLILWIGAIMFGYAYNVLTAVWPTL